ncbi:MAG TPA: hypothetical protein VNO52_03040, partial [Methylomirabilota bacterium]|nr:hypothetical protein [Methylomirabilota bacterium]
MKTVIDTMLGAAVLAGLLGTTGCQTYNQQNKGTPLWRSGNVPAAIKEFSAKAEKEKTGKDTVIWRLEQGTA